MLKQHDNLNNDRKSSKIHNNIIIQYKKNNI